MNYSIEEVIEKLKAWEPWEDDDLREICEDYVTLTLQVKAMEVEAAEQRVKGLQAQLDLLDSLQVKVVAAQFVPESK